MPKKIRTSLFSKKPFEKKIKNSIAQKVARKMPIRKESDTTTPKIKLINSNTRDHFLSAKVDFDFGGIDLNQAKNLSFDLAISMSPRSKFNNPNEYFRVWNGREKFGVNPTVSPIPNNQDHLSISVEFPSSRHQSFGDGISSAPDQITVDVAGTNKMTTHTSTTNDEDPIIELPVAGIRVFNAKLTLYNGVVYDLGTASINSGMLVVDGEDDIDEGFGGTVRPGNVFRASIRDVKKIENTNPINLSTGNRGTSGS